MAYVLRDRDSDELGGRVNSDSEASEDEEEITDRVHSVADPTGPWKQKPVDGDTWGRPTRGYSGRKPRDFASANTGPKGVINDYKAHKRYQKQERMRKEAERQAVLNRIAKGATVVSGPGQTQLDCECDGDSDCECDEDLLDSEFLAQYAENRVKQMQAAARNRKVFGELEYITPERFVELTSTTDSRDLMLIHLYHPDNYACGLLNTQLELLAQKLIHVKFAALVAKEADASIELSDLPVVLIFRGQQQETIVDVARRLDGEFTLERVETLVNEQLGL
ncbi:Phosducin-like protein [Phytophthora citrophthora]|uniref:Phosducin-like protein n=1 Tax=Phytophthora citrophthora TaxID=4793 RepID=A0AAD9GLB8_9STRA|nr:Phosducin-like protein [Phytophthora citrophthora]